MCYLFGTQERLASQPTGVLSPLRKVSGGRGPLSPPCSMPAPAGRGWPVPLPGDLCPLLAVSSSTQLPTGQPWEDASPLWILASASLGDPKAGCSLSGQLRLLESSARLCWPLSAGSSSRHGQLHGPVTASSVQRGP